MAAAEGQTVLQFVPSPAGTSARVHPVVLFGICDSYVRRPDQAERVIGTLLGSVAPDGTVEIRNSYAVPHNESSDQVPSLSFALMPIFICRGFARFPGWRRGVCVAPMFHDLLFTAVYFLTYGVLVPFEAFPSLTVHVILELSGFRVSFVVTDVSSASSE